MKAYLSYPIQGKDFATVKLKAEGRASKLARWTGWDIVNPLDVQPECGKTASPCPSAEHDWSCFLRYDLIALLSCDAIILCREWQDSFGARLEQSVAAQCGLQLFSFYDNDFVKHFGSEPLLWDIVEGEAVPLEKL